MTKHILAYNNSWGLCILLSVAFNICNVIFMSPFLAAMGFAMLLSAVLICVINTRKGGMVYQTIEYRSNSLFSLKPRVFGISALSGLILYLLGAVIIVFLWANPVFAICRYLFLLLVMSYIYAWNTGWIRHTVTDSDNTDS